jgi:prepilin-type processing-associated H-X9-DG protein
MRSPWANPSDNSSKGRWAGTPGFRHQRRSNAAFSDGHAKSLRIRLLENKDGSANVPNGTGFLSPDNSIYDLE